MISLNRLTTQVEKVVARLRRDTNPADDDPLAGWEERILTAPRATVSPLAKLAAIEMPTLAVDHALPDAETATVTATVTVTQSDTSLDAMEWRRDILKERIDYITPTIVRYQHYCEYLEAAHDTHSQNYLEVIHIKHMLEIQLVEALAKLAAEYSKFGMSPSYATLNGNASGFQSRWQNNVKELVQRMKYVLSNPQDAEEVRPPVINQELPPTKFVRERLALAVREISTFYLESEDFVYLNQDFRRTIIQLLQHPYISTHLREHINPHVQSWMDFHMSKSMLEG